MKKFNIFIIILILSISIANIGAITPFNQYYFRSPNLAGPPEYYDYSSSQYTCRYYLAETLTWGSTHGVLKTNMSGQGQFTINMSFYWNIASSGANTNNILMGLTTNNTNHTVYVSPPADGNYYFTIMVEKTAGNVPQLWIRRYDNGGLVDNTNIAMGNNNVTRLLTVERNNLNWTEVKLYYTNGTKILNKTFTGDTQVYTYFVGPSRINGEASQYTMLEASMTYDNFGGGGGGGGPSENINHTQYVPVINESLYFDNVNRTIQTYTVSTGLLYNVEYYLNSSLIRNVSLIGPYYNYLDTFSINISSLQAGRTYNLYSCGKGVIGENCSSKWFYITNFSNSNPNLYIFYPTYNYNFSTSTWGIVGFASDIETYIDDIYIYMDGILEKTFLNLGLTGYEFAYENVTTTGQHSLTVLINDSTGLTNSTTLLFNVAPIPDFLITSPSEDSYYNYSDNITIGYGITNQSEYFYYMEIYVNDNLIYNTTSNYLAKQFIINENYTSYENTIKFILKSSIGERTKIRTININRINEFYLKDKFTEADVLTGTLYLYYHGVPYKSYSTTNGVIKFSVNSGNYEILINSPNYKPYRDDTVELPIGNVLILLEPSDIITTYKNIIFHTFDNTTLTNISALINLKSSVNTSLTYDCIGNTPCEVKSGSYSAEISYPEYKTEYISYSIQTNRTINISMNPATDYFKITLWLKDYKTSELINGYFYIRNADYSFYEIIPAYDYKPTIFYTKSDNLTFSGKKDGWEVYKYIGKNINKNEEITVLMFEPTILDYYDLFINVYNSVTNELITEDINYEIVKVDSNKLIHSSTIENGGHSITTTLIKGLPYRITLTSDNYITKQYDFNFTVDTYLSLKLIKKSTSYNTSQYIPEDDTSTALIQDKATGFILRMSRGNTFIASLMIMLLVLYILSKFPETPDNIKNACYLLTMIFLISIGWLDLWVGILIILYVAFTISKRVREYIGISNKNGEE